MENINLMRELAWSFHRTTGMDYEELYSEAIINYLESFSHFDDEKGLRFETWAFIYAKRKIIDYIRKQRTFKNKINFVPEYLYELDFSCPTSENGLENLNEDLKTILDLLMNKKYRDDLTPANIRYLLKQDLIQKNGWEASRVKENFHELSIIANKL